MMGIFGGAAFLIIYLFIVLAFGIPSLVGGGAPYAKGPPGSF